MHQDDPINPAGNTRLCMKTQYKINIMPYYKISVFGFFATCNNAMAVAEGILRKLARATSHCPNRILLKKLRKTFDRILKEQKTKCYRQQAFEVRKLETFWGKK